MIRLTYCVLLALLSLTTMATVHAADEPQTITLNDATRQRCVDILRTGLHSDDFWPSIHAAEGLTLSGHGDEVIAYLTPRLATEKDDQRRCGIARELVRAGNKSKVAVMVTILASDDDYGHTHAAESLYKVGLIGDGKAMQLAFSQPDDLRLRLMAAAALGKQGDPDAMKVIRTLLRHDDPELFKVAAWILGRIGDKSDIARIKHELPRCKQEVTRAYLDHALAALGDANGLKSLRRNLTSNDPAIRTYAATFAGDARAVNTADILKNLLDDSHPDTRYRAAQSLLVLASP